MSNIMLIVMLLAIGCAVFAVVLIALLAMWSASND
jgi:hypothetical protein